MNTSSDPAEVFFAQSRKEWADFIQHISGSSNAQAMRWDNHESIIEVLSAAAKSCPHNHAFCPMGGGHDLKGATQSIEPQCIELNLGPTYIVAPSSLTLTRIGHEDLWSYLRLETDTLSPQGDDTDPGDTEELTRLPNGRLLPRSAWDEGTTGELDENGCKQELPYDSQIIARCLTGGPFVVFAKGSFYNQNSSTYDACHAKMSAIEFAEYIRKTADATT